MSRASFTLVGFVVAAVAVIACGKGESSSQSARAPAAEESPTAERPQGVTEGGRDAASRPISPGSDRPTTEADATEAGDRALEAMLASPDPRIEVPRKWRRCKATADCVEVYSPCGTGRVVVNKRSEKLAEEAWAAACGGMGSFQAMHAPSVMECDDGLCSDPGAMGFGGIGQ